MTAEYRFPSVLEGWQHSISSSTHLLHMMQEEAWLVEDSVDRESFSGCESSGNGLPYCVIPPSVWCLLSQHQPAKGNDGRAWSVPCVQISRGTRRWHSDTADVYAKH